MKLLDFIVPALLGFFSGLLPPLIIEKWKSNKEEKKKLTLLEKDLGDLQNNFNSVSSSFSSIEERVRTLELNLSHNTGVLKAKIPGAALEDATTK